MARAKATPKQEVKVYPPGYFEFDADKGTRGTEEIIAILFCPENGTLRDSLELQQIARAAITVLTDEPKSLRVIAEEADLLGKQLPLLYVLGEMAKKKRAIGDVQQGFQRFVENTLQ